MYGFAAGCGAGVENCIVWRWREEIEREGGRRVLDDECAVGKPRDVFDALAAFEFLESASGIGEERLGGRVVPGGEAGRRPGAETGRPALDEFVRETFAHCERHCGEAFFDRGAGADQIAQDAVHHLGDGALGA